MRKNLSVVVLALPLALHLTTALVQALIPVIAFLLAGAIVALPLGTLDPLWLTGIYDGGDYDDLLTLAEQGAAAPAPPEVRPKPGRPMPSLPRPSGLAGGIRSMTAARAPPGAGRDDLPRRTPSLIRQTLGGLPLAPALASPIPVDSFLTRNLARTSLVASPSGYRGHAPRAEGRADADG